MARPLRIEQIGGWHHVTSRGIDRRKIFLDDLDRRHWLELLGEAVDRYGWILHGYVLMENHFHTITQIQEANLSGSGWGGNPSGPGAGAAATRAFAHLPLELLPGVCGRGA